VDQAYTTISPPRSHSTASTRAPSTEILRLPTTSLLPNSVPLLRSEWMNIRSVWPPVAGTRTDIVHLKVCSIDEAYNVHGNPEVLKLVPIESLES